MAWEEAEESAAVHHGPTLYDLDLHSTLIQVDALDHTPTPF